MGDNYRLYTNVKKSAAAELTATMRRNTKNLQATENLSAVGLRISAEADCTQPLRYTPFMYTMAGQTKQEAK